MPLTEHKPDAVSQNYARALFDMAQAKGGNQAVETIQGELEDVLELARQDKNFSEFLASRVIASKRRRPALEKMFRGNIHDLLLNFILLLNDRERLAELPAIAASLDHLVQTAFGRVEVDIFTAEPVSPDALRTIGERLGQIMGKQVIAHGYVDSSLIGGVKFQIGDQLIDASVATRLRRMRDKLATDGSAALKARFDAIIDERSN
jgi:F-type H+-transporting ATPase subunit delta